MLLVRIRLSYTFSLLLLNWVSVTPPEKCLDIYKHFFLAVKGGGGAGGGIQWVETKDAAQFPTMLRSYLQQGHYYQNVNPGG